MFSKLPKKYDSILEADNINSLKKLYKIAENGNTNNFVWLSYGVDANNTMYECTGNRKYLDYNYNIVKMLLKSGSQDTVNSNLHFSRRWIAKIKKGTLNEKMNQKEFFLFEGYLFRYLAKFAYLVNKDLIYDSRKNDLVFKFVEDNFLKVYKHSLQLDGDLSRLFEIRTHMGSHWAKMALYLNLITKDPTKKELYEKVTSGYNQGLKDNFKLKSTKKGTFYYQWNSSWDKPFTARQKQRKSVGKDKDRVQDVSHGNQVVEYILTSHDLGYDDWTENELQFLLNTLNEKIWLSKTGFADSIDGSISKVKNIRGSGHKQSFGWMKLMNYDDTGELYKKYKVFYEDNKAFIDSMYLNLQYYANFFKYEVDNDEF